MFWSVIAGIIIVLLLLSGLFDVVSWQINSVLIGVVILLWLVSIYNTLVQLRNRVRESLSDIDVQLKRRYDLIPNLIEIVKGYLTHEKEVLQKVTEARARLNESGNPLSRAHEENILSGTLKTLFAVAENYPDLKANANFLELQRELSDTENKIQAARRFYNSTVLALNTKVETFPEMVIANLFGFRKEEFFEADAAEKEPVQVKF